MTTESQRSPSWGTTTKLVIGLTLVAILAGIFIYYRSIVSLLVLASIITYLFQPIVALLTEKTRLSWRMSTTTGFSSLYHLIDWFVNWSGPGYRPAGNWIGARCSGIYRESYLIWQTISLSSWNSTGSKISLI